MLRCLSVLFVFLTIFIELSPAQEVVAQKIVGRVDAQIVAQPVLQTLQAGDMVAPGTVLQVATNSALTAQIGIGANVVVYGPARLRVGRILAENGGYGTILFSEISGQVDFYGQNPQILTFNCLQTALRQVWGIGSLKCEPEQYQVEVYMDQGTVEIEREGAHVIALEPGFIWRGQVTAHGYREVKVPRPVAATPAASAGQVKLVWQPTAVSAPSPQWNIDRFFKNMVLQDSALTEQEAGSEWLVATKVTRFAMRSTATGGILDLELRFDLQNQRFPLQGRVLRYQQEFVLKLQGATKLEFLQLLPLDLHNAKIMENGFEQVQQGVRQFVTKEIADPFNRAGYNLQNEEVIEKLNL